MNYVIILVRFNLLITATIILLRFPIIEFNSIVHILPGVIWSEESFPPSFGEGPFIPSRAVFFPVPVTDDNSS